MAFQNKRCDLVCVERRFKEGKLLAERRRENYYLILLIIEEVSKIT